jgi:hypothetical protein
MFWFVPKFSQVGSDAIIRFGALSSAILQSRKTRDVWFYRYDHVNQDITILDITNTVFNVALETYIIRSNKTTGIRIFPGPGSIVYFFSTTLSRYFRLPADAVQCRYDR